MGLTYDGEYCVLADGWIKIDRSDYAVGGDRAVKGRMLLGLNQLLLFKSGRHILIDTGLGEKWIREDLTLLDFQLPRHLRAEFTKHNVTPEEIDVVIFTHLHYDHSGGATYRNGNLVAPTFPNAVYYVQEAELSAALDPAESKIADYQKDDILPLLECGALKPINGEYEVIPGITLYPAPGHSPGHQIVRIDLKSGTLLFAGDLISTRSHANLKYTMIYDDDRELILHHRRYWIEAAVRGNWDVFFCHAPRNPIGKISS